MLIANQAREIAELKEELSEYKEAMQKLHNMMVCIGGPLNDNVLSFDKEQLAFLFRLHNNMIYD